MNHKPLVSVQDLRVTFLSPDGALYAVNGVNFELAQGQVLGLLGESGCGKSVTLRSLLRLHPEKRSRIEGRITVDGRDVLQLNPAQLGAYRGKVVSMIFQDPMLAFDPVFTVGSQIVETIIEHEGCSKASAKARAIEMLERVKIPSARQRFDNYPFEMSGGMRQRAMIALALACKPKLLLADEPTTALDATVQIQILVLLRELQQEFGMSMIFVTHDIGVAAEVSDQIAVMYGGRIIEQGAARDVVHAPVHPYTQGLLAATVLPGMDSSTRLQAIPGSPCRLSERPAGCSFAPRCSLVQPACSAAVPGHIEAGPGHSAACIRM